MICQILFTGKSKKNISIYHLLTFLSSMSAEDKLIVFSYSITKTYLYNFDPLKPHFYIVKLGFTGVYIILLISARKHRLWVLDRGSSNEYPQSVF